MEGFEQMESLLSLTPAQLIEKGIVEFQGDLYIQSRRLLSYLAEYSDNDEIFLLYNIRWAITREYNWLWESKFKDMPVRKIVETVANDHINGTNELQEEC